MLRLRTGGRLILAWVPLLVAGCGLKEYEERMIQSQQRLQRFEEETRYLDSPLMIPTLKDSQGKTLPVNLFFRPPRGIADKAQNEAEPRNRLLYSYRPRQGAMAGVFALVELALGEPGKGFAGEVIGSFSGADKPTTRQRPVQGPGREAYTFQTTEFDDGQHFYSVNIWPGSKFQVAIVYWVARGQQNAAQQAIRLSLESFAVGADAMKQRERLSRTPLEVPGHR